MLTRVSKTAVLPICLILAACGGGGGGTTTTEASGANAPAPTPSASPAQSGGNTPSPASVQPSGETETPASAPTPGNNSTGGEVVVSFNYDQTARFMYPVRIVRDSAGTLYVLDQPDFNSPLPLDSDPAGNERIRKIASDGNVTTLPGTIVATRGMTTIGEDLYVAVINVSPPIPSGQNGWTDIVRYAPDGSRTTVARYSRGPGSSDPFLLTSDTRGNIFVAKKYRQFVSIDRIDSTGNVTEVFNFSTRGSVADVQSDANGNLTISFSTRDGRQFIGYAPQSSQPVTTTADASGEYGFPTAAGITLQEVDFGGNAALDAAGNLYLVMTSSTTITPATGSEPGTYDLTSITVTRIAPDRTTTSVYNGLPAGITTRYTGFTSAYHNDFAVAPGGDLYLSLPFDHTVYRISSGQATLIAGKNGEAGSSD